MFLLWNLAAIWSVWFLLDFNVECRNEENHFGRSTELASVCVWCTLLLFRIKEEMWALLLSNKTSQCRTPSHLHSSSSLVHNYTDMDMWAYISQVVVLTTWIMGTRTCYQVGGSQMMLLLLKLVTKMWFSACQHMFDLIALCISLNCDWISSGFRVKSIIWWHHYNDI